MVVKGKSVPVKILCLVFMIPNFMHIKTGPGPVKKISFYDISLCGYQ